MWPAGTIFVVFNASAGHGDAAQALEAIERALRAAGRSYELRKARGRDAEAVAALAAQEAAACSGIVAAAGGDGTLNTVANAAFAADVPFGAVPLGTFNYFARENGIPLEPSQAATLLDPR